MVQNLPIKIGVVFSGVRELDHQPGSFSRLSSATWRGRPGFRKAAAPPLKNLARHW
jgi:hypothetical protein